MFIANHATHPMNHTSHKQGFTLVEVMVTCLIGILLVGTLMTLFLAQRRALHATGQLNEMQQNLRAGMSPLTRELAMTGYGLPVIQEHIDDWLTWGPEMTTNPTIIDGSGVNPDTIHMAAAFEPPFTSTVTLSTNGQHTITLESGAAHLVNLTNRSVLFLGKCEVVRVVGISGDVLTISSHPVTRKGLMYNHLPGDPVELVKIVSYTCLPDPGQFPNKPVLVRHENLDERPVLWQRIVATGIDNLQVTRDPGEPLAIVELMTRTEERDPFYTDPDHNDNYRRQTMTSSAYMVNRR